MTPQLRYLDRKNRQKGPTQSNLVPVTPEIKDLIPHRSSNNILEESEDDGTLDLLQRKETSDVVGGNAIAVNNLPSTRVLKKKKLKINGHTQFGNRVVFDEEGNTLPPFAALADTRAESALLDKDKVYKRFADLREEMKRHDKEDKQLDHQRRKEKRTKEKNKHKRARDEENDGFSGSDKASRNVKRNKAYFDSDSDTNESKAKVALKTDAVSLTEQESLPLSY